ncbi:DUF2125 domain-containing protein [Falsirhodobacter sp. alg1]|uniref:DUF2125 domain-containing protein n=1 Tax=Falsirhodobacter sp. alg1 TaxID=1472418 RepID=UPI0007876709|nr:DUF2125 domain-containing protein [Falsirhodobacter sp. alg1]
MKSSHLFTASLIGLGLSSGGVLAGVTPEQVWQDWSAGAEGTGAVITAESTSTEGGAFVARGVKMVLPDSDVAIEATIAGITFRDRGDGSVAVVPMLETPVAIRATPSSVAYDPDPSTFEANLILRENALSIVASGDPGAVKYDYTADMLGFLMTDMTGDDEPLPLRAEVNLADLRGDFQNTGEMASHMTADAVDAQFASSGDTVSFIGNHHLNNLVMEGKGSTLAAITGGLGMTDRVNAGFESWNNIAYSDSTFDFAFSDRSVIVKGKGTTGPGSTRTSVSAEGSRSAGDLAEIALNVDGNRLPVVVDAAIDNLDWDVDTSPLAADGAQTVAAKIGLAGLTVSDPLWDMFDPQRAFPRDPADLRLDLQGKIAGPAGDDGEKNLEQLTINDFQLRLAGAELGATGEFTLPPYSMDSFPIAPPEPDGTLNLKLRGGNSVIDSAIAAGLLPQEQALGARMILGMFGRPVRGEEDTVTSTVEMKDGGISVNGQRLR